LSEVEKLKRELREQRMSDPHAWAYEMERRIDNRSLVGITAFLISLALAVNVWLLWKQRDILLDRVTRLEAQTEGYTPSSPEIEALIEKYAPGVDACGNVIPEGTPELPPGFCLVD
jgi:hypothetical protein